MHTRMRALTPMLCSACAPVLNLATGNHPNIVEILGIYYTSREQKSYMNLIMEYVPHTLSSVLSFLEKEDLRMKHSNVQIYMFQVLLVFREFARKKEKKCRGCESILCVMQLARALLFLHSQDIVHRDIKPDNILINTEATELKLSDFGSAKKLVPGEPSITYMCSRFYRAPELILDRNLYGPAIDTWSYGCILAEIAIGIPLFTGVDACV